VTVVATHLEDLTTPANRRKQLGELLDQIKGIDHPVIVAGDMNTSTHDAAPLSVTRALKQRFGSARWWAEEGAFFDALDKFRFAGGYAFDFRGERARTSNGRAGNLADSNERGEKGFVPTNELGRAFGPNGKYKLDWIFVRPVGLTEPRDVRQPYRFAPHFGRTLKGLNQSIPERVSDHNPVTVDLPLEEPPPLPN
jgi:endonuclease/exonuclease/phosphatase family metal-dependent hydrolase